MNRGGGAGAQGTHLSIQRASRVDGNRSGLDHRGIHIPSERHVAEGHLLQRHASARQHVDTGSLFHREVGDCRACKPRSSLGRRTRRATLQRQAPARVLFVLCSHASYRIAAQAAVLTKPLLVVPSSCYKTDCLTAAHTQLAVVGLVRSDERSAAARRMLLTTSIPDTRSTPQMTAGSGADRHHCGTVAGTAAPAANVA